MVELYTIQSYLQYSTLEKHDLQHFDAWASNYGETVVVTELKPGGTGYRSKTRFARFNNLPELMAMFKEVADIKTADMLDLPVPEVEYHNVAVKPSQIQKDMVSSLAERAEAIRAGGVDSRVDNMLKITNDGRKLALDQRMLNEMLPDDEGSKVNACINEVYRIWEENTDKRSTQLLFCDLSTPKGEGVFSVYTDIRKKLIERGIPESEIKFIHEADTEAKKQELFKKVRKGEVRILLGSTQKMGAGTNVQNKIIASHDIDCPWRPSDLEQRAGRTVRQGNENPKVHLYRYVTEDTFDAYLYQLVEGKQKFASQIMTSKSPVRSCEDIDETALSYAEIKMLATGNPYIKEKMDLDIQVSKLRLLKSSYLSEKYALEDKIIKYYPKKIAQTKELITGLESDLKRADEHPKPTDDRFVGIEVQGVFFSERVDAGQKIIETCTKMTSPDPIPLGKYRGFDLELSFEAFEKVYQVRVKGDTSRTISLGTDAAGNISRIDNAIEKIPERLELQKQELESVEKQLTTARKEVEKQFDKEQELIEWLETIDISKAARRKTEFVKNQSDLFINFNYTDTLESVYGIKDVLHIHGGIPTCSTTLPIMGHGNKYLIDLYRRKAKEAQEEFVEWEESICNAIADYCETLYKDTDKIISFNEKFFSLLQNVEQIICLGLSFGNVDIPYLVRIQQEIKPTTKWKVYYYDLAALKRLKDVFGILGITRKYEVYFLQSDSFWD